MILEAGQVQIERSHSNMPSFITKYRFVSFIISILTSKTISDHHKSNIEFNKHNFRQMKASIPVSGQPPAASTCQDIFSSMRMNILILANLHLDIK